MKRLASDVLRELEVRVANLEKESRDDIDLARDIELSLVNDSGMYRMIQAVIANQQKHYAKGRWTEAGGIKGFENVVKAYLPKYKKEYDMPYLRVSGATKKAVAKELLDYYMDEIQEG
jgi:hypothetical protein